MSETKPDALALPDAFRALAEHVKDALVSKEPAKLAEAHRILDALDDKLKRMSGMVKTELKLHIQAHGTPVGDKGSKELEVAGYKYPLRSMVAAGTLDDRKVEAKLRAKGISVESGMNATVSYRANREKLRLLSGEGRGVWTPQDFKDCEVDQKWALYPPEKVTNDE